MLDGENWGSIEATFLGWSGEQLSRELVLESNLEASASARKQLRRDLVLESN